MLFELLLIFIAIPLTTVFIYLSFDKLKVLDKMGNSSIKIVSNLGTCMLCFCTWCNIFINSIYAVASGQYHFFLFTAAFIVISLYVLFKFTNHE